MSAPKAWHTIAADIVPWWREDLIVVESELVAKCTFAGDRGRWVETQCVLARDKRNRYFLLVLMPKRGRWLAAQHPTVSGCIDVGKLDGSPFSDELTSLLARAIPYGEKISIDS